MKISDERFQKYMSLANKRQRDITIILENVYDTHNLGAAMRSCDAIGISDVYVLYTDPELQRKEFKIGKRTTAGTKKWVQIHYFQDIDYCFEEVRKKYKRIFSTHLSDKSQELYDLDLSKPSALLFGNESDGVSQEALQKSDGNFIIPQMGMVESLNISVACAVSLFEAMRQRISKNMYSDPEGVKESAQPLLDQYMELHKSRKSQMPVIRYRKK